MIYSTSHPSPIGVLTLACEEGHLVGLWMRGQKYYGGSILEAMTERDDRPVFAAAKEWLNRYFAGHRPSASELPLHPAGSVFQQEVWRILREIPYGETVTYKDVAQKMAAKIGKGNMSARAVGGAVGHNPISIIIPCHRVVGSNGNLTGYAGGISTKLRLLELEGVDPLRARRGGHPSV